MTQSHKATSAPPKNSTLAIASMVLGIVSIVGFMGFILGIPAIILGIIALKKGEGEKGMSVTGIVTGAISTLISLLLIIFFAILFIVAAADNSSPGYLFPDQPTDYDFDNSAPSSHAI